MMTANVTSRNFDFNLPVFSQVLAQLLRLLLCSLCPLRSNENLKTIVELTLILSNQANVEQSPLPQALYVPGSLCLWTQMIN